MRVLKVADVKKWNRVMAEMEEAPLGRRKTVLTRMLKSMYRTFDPADPYAAMLIETTEQALMTVTLQIKGGEKHEKNRVVS